jgi:hypothetical protein
MLNNKRQRHVITRAVQTMSSIHQTSIIDTARKIFYSPKHFPKVLGGILSVSFIAGYVCMGYVHDYNVEKRKRIYIDAYHNNNNKTDSTIKQTDRQSTVSVSTTQNSTIGGDRLAMIARKMTHRIATQTNNLKESSMIQRQYTKVW